MPYKDLERRRAYGREWMRRNAEKAREAMRRWRARHPEEHRAEGRAYYARDPIRKNGQIDTSPNRHAVRRAVLQRRRSRLLQLEGSFSYREWIDLIRFHGGRCAYCGGPGPLEVDHRIPLSRGGTNLIDNILPACRRCNARKHTMTEEEFRACHAAEAQGIRRLREASLDEVCGPWLCETPMDEADGPGSARRR